MPNQTSEEDASSITNRLLREFRLTYSELARYADSTERTVGRWARGESAPTSAKLRRAIRALGARPSDYGFPDTPDLGSQALDGQPAWAIRMEGKLDTIVRILENAPR